MIEKARRRFFRISLIALTVAMVAVTTAINIANWVDVRTEMMDMLAFLTKYEGKTSGEDAARWAGPSRHRRNLLEESNFFVGLYRPSGKVSLLNPGRGETENTDEAVRMIGQAGQSGQSEGRIGDFFFSSAETPGGRRYVFLSGETRLRDVRHLILFSAAACFIGILLAMAAVNRFSLRAIEPLVRNERQQKRFITDVSHELKTPLTVISANMDVLALDDRENTWVRSTQKQVSQMRRLVDELVYLSRLEENDVPLEKKTVFLDSLTEETAEPFAAMAEFQGKHMEMTLQKGLSLQGDEKVLQRLVSVLCDNAVKYAPEGDEISLILREEGRNIVLETRNTSPRPLTAEQCERLFDRFYRADESRARDGSGGYGIGLAIAAAAAKKHGGSMSAEMGENSRLILRCTLPRSA